MVRSNYEMSYMFSMHYTYTHEHLVVQIGKQVSQ